MPDQPEAPATPWPDWLADLTPEDRVREIVSLHAHWCHGADGRCPGSEAVDLLMRLLGEARQQAHYLSTSCFHGEHRYCQSGTGAAESGETWSKVPAKCKFCPATCRCGCHSGEAAAAAEPVSFAAAMELRAQIAEALDGFLSTEQATIAADSVMVVVVPLLRSAAEPAGEPQGGNPAAEVPSEPVIDAVTRVREWAAAEPSGLMLRRDVVGTLDRVLAMSPERAAELADYRGRIAKAVALLHQSSEYAISDALAGHLTRILSDPPRTGSGPARGEGGGS